MWHQSGMGAASEQRVEPLPYPTRPCAVDRFAQGFVLGAAHELELLDRADRKRDGGVLEWRSKRSGELVRSVALPAAWVETATSAGDRVVVAFEHGVIGTYPDGPSFTTPQSALDGTRKEYFFLRLWAADERLLWADADWQGPLWTTAGLDGSQARVIARGGVGRCGHPLVDRRALALADQGRSVVALPLDAGGAIETVQGNPLATSQCVAGDQEIVAVTGRADGLPAVAIHGPEGRWQVLRFPESASVAEPLVQQGLVIVSVPEEDGARPNRRESVRAAGAVYVLARTAGTWSIRERIVAGKVRDHGLFGFAVRLDTEYLFVNHLIDSQDRDAIGAPVVCRTPLSGSTPTSP